MQADAVPVSSSDDWLDETFVSAELASRLYRGSQDSVIALAARLSPRQRANLAVYCYRKSHLHRIGLALAATCDLETLIQVMGTALGRVLFAQSREGAPDGDRRHGPPRSRVTLAARAGIKPVISHAVADEDEGDDAVAAQS